MIRSPFIFIVTQNLPQFTGRDKFILFL